MSADPTTDGGARPTPERWNTRLGVILAVAGSAVGLGNFLRFPGLAAQFGGGAFMVAYFTAFLLIGLPICWAEWTMGRMGGKLGFNSSPGILAAVTRNPKFRFLGIIAVIIPVVIYMYYVVIEAWCLAYATNYLGQLLGLDDTMAFANEAGKTDPARASGFFAGLIGVAGDGEAFKFGWQHVGAYFVAVFILNFVLIYRGLSKGIEWFCRYAMPLLVVVALVVLIRVLTLDTPDAEHPERNINNGLGFMWNPAKVYLEARNAPPPGGDADSASVAQWSRVAQILDPQRLQRLQAVIDDSAAVREVMALDSSAETASLTYRIHEVSLWEQLFNAELWLKAAGQIFFTLSVGFGVIITYASYLKRDDDVVLSGLAASSANELCEVGIGGLLSVPAGVAFFGTAFMLTQIDSTFSMGFNVLPLVFAEMPGGAFFGFLFFFLLFLAAVTSSISMLQPGIAYLEDSMGISRRQSVSILGLITAFGAGFVVYFSADLKALDTLDFWVTNLFMVSLALVQVILFAWVIGLKRGFAEADEGASFRIPPVFGFIMKYVSPVFLLVILGAWLATSVFGIFGEPAYYITDLLGTEDTPPKAVAWMSVALILLVGVFIWLLLPNARQFMSRVDAHAQADDRDGGNL